MQLPSGCWLPGGARGHRVRKPSLGRGLGGPTQMSSQHLPELSWSCHSVLGKSWRPHRGGVKRGKDVNSLMCPLCLGRCQAQQGNKPAHILNSIQPAGVGIRGHQRLLAEDTSRSLGAIPSGWGVLGRSELGKAGAREWRGGTETSHCSVPMEHGVGQSRRARLLGPTHRQAHQQLHVVSPWL